MTMLGSSTCLMCDEPVELGGSNVFTPEYTVRCRRCGEYGISRIFGSAPHIPSELRVCISAATRQASELGKPILLQRGNLVSIAVPHQNVRVMVKVEKALRYVAAKCGQPGKSTLIEPQFDYPVADCSEPSEFVAYLTHLQEKSFLQKHSQGNRWDVEPTIDGWQYLEPRVPVGGIPGRCFVAMSFDASLDEAYELGIKPALIGCGFEVICMKEIPTNEGITDRILAEIRLAQFVVADVTGQRGGVYFEGGFAKGLGRKVIWCCRRDDLPQVHFDIRHFGHVLWETVEDLKDKLTASIRANIIPER